MRVGGNALRVLSPWRLVRDWVVNPHDPDHCTMGGGARGFISGHPEDASHSGCTPPANRLTGSGHQRQQVRGLGGPSQALHSRRPLLTSAMAPNPSSGTSDGGVGLMIYITVSYALCSCCCCCFSLSIPRMHDIDTAASPRVHLWSG